MSALTQIIAAWRFGSEGNSSTTRGSANSATQNGRPAPENKAELIGETPQVSKAPATELASSVDRYVPTAFALGWHMAELYVSASLDKERHENGRDELPSLAALSPHERTQFTMQEASADLYKLRGHFVAAGLKPVSMNGLNEALEAGSINLDSLRRRIKAMHVELMPALSAADFRLGKAYVLGRGLANTCLRPDDEESFDYAFGSRVVGIKSSLADLASAFPSHASRSVVLSLRTWEAWASDPELDGEALDYDRQWAGVRSALRRQGELWRALLSGEKQAHDMLEPADYLQATKRLVRQTSAMCRRLLIPLLLPVTILAILLCVGIAFALLSSDGARIIGAAAAALGALGITGAGIRARMSIATQQLERGFWGAEMDLVIAEAVTVGPDDWGEQVGQHQVPATGELPKAATNLEVLKRFQVAVAKEKKHRAKKLLAPHVEFHAPDGSKIGANEVVEWLFSAPEREEIAAVPERVVAGRPGFLVADVAGGSDLWRLREGQIRVWQRFADRNDARIKAGLRPLA